MKECRSIGDYIMLNKISKGGQGSIWQVQKKDSEDKEIYALKRIKIKNPKAKKLADRELYYRPILNHNYIVETVDHIIGEDIYYIIYKNYPTDLLKFLKSKQYNRINETAVKRWMMQLLEAMVHLNTHRIMHRDLKPDNLLLTSDSEDADIKLCDFGLIRRHIREENSESQNTYKDIPFNYGLEAVNKTLTHVGTLEYAAPEVKKLKDYNMKCDVWSVGVITHVLLYGKYPHITNSKVNFPLVDDSTSEIAKKFMEDCLEVNIKKRPYFIELISHEFFNSRQKNSSADESTATIENAKCTSLDLSDVSKCTDNDKTINHKRERSSQEEVKAPDKHQKIESNQSTINLKFEELVNSKILSQKVGEPTQNNKKLETAQSFKESNCEESENLLDDFYELGPIESTKN